MKKALTLLLIILASVLTGCSLLEQFQHAEEQYLETRVSELVEETTTQEAAIGEPTSEVPEDIELLTEEAPAETPTISAEFTAETPEEPTSQPTEEPSADETPLPTEEPTPEPTVVSDDPAVYLGEPDWVDEMDKAQNWPVGIDDYTAASFENGAMKFVALSELPGWRIASTSELGNAYIEASIKMGNACSETDSYGIIFRVPKNSDYNRGYLFGVTCDGRYNLRMWDGFSGESGKSVTLKYFTPSSAILKGKNQTNRLGVMTVGDRIILYINGVQVDEIVDDTYDLGYFGVFINQDRTKNLTVFVEEVRYWLAAEPK